MAPGETWVARRYDRSSRQTKIGRETAGAGCSRVLRSLDVCLRGGLNNPGGSDEGATRRRGQFPGAALWEGKVVRPSGAGEEEKAQTDEPEGWETRVSQSGVAPHEDSILDAAKVWYGCRRPPNERPCDDVRCPTCWEGADLQHDLISCSRFKHNVPTKVSSGLGRFKGGNVRLATSDGPYPRAWAVGHESGEDVEIYRNPSALSNGLAGDGGVTLAKILYFFQHEGNRRSGDSLDGGPLMEYVLVYEYVTCGAGRSKRPDSVTEHPTYFLRGAPSQKPSVFPVEAIRRHVHMYHQCTQASFAPGGVNEGGSAGADCRCGLRRESAADGGGVVWKHHFHLARANPDTRQRDVYMLNEHWHSPFQDGVI